FVMVHPTTGTAFGNPPLPDTPGLYATWNFGGPHPGGWTAVFCDGAVRYLSYEMDPMMHRWMGNRQDGNPIDQSQL
ncbi:MAG TPA: hypothetical protein VGK58_15465, partial [Lacipirellulaceae bacterium]